MEDLLLVGRIRHVTHINLGDISMHQKIVELIKKDLPRLNNI